MDSAGLHTTSNTITENPDLLGKRDDLQTDDWLASPEHTRDDQGDTAAKEIIHTDTGKGPIMREPLLQITDWDSRTLLGQDEDSLKRSRYRIGGSADSVLSLASSQSLQPLEWKTLRSSQSQGTLARFSDDTLESTDGGYKPALDSNQDVVDDIIGDEVAFKVCAHMFNHNLGASYSVDSRTNYPIVHPGSPSPNDTNYPQQCSNGSQCMPVMCPRTEKLSEFGMQVNQANNSGADQEDSHLSDQFWATVASPKSLYNTNTAPTGYGSNSNNHEEKDVSNQQWSTPSLPVSECSSPVILQQQIVNLKSQIRDLQEAKETAVLELAKADEEISQLKHEMTQLKSDYLQKLADSKEENVILKRKINRIHNSHGPVDTYEQALRDEICQLRNESRSLREISHQLNEENHRLNEELWDAKNEWLKHTVIDKQNERLQEHSRNNASPSSMNSESTEMLVAGYYDTSLAKESRDLRDEHTTKAKHNSNNFSCTGQHNQTSHENSELLISHSASSSLSEMDICTKYSLNKHIQSQQSCYCLVWPQGRHSCPIKKNAAQRGGYRRWLQWVGQHYQEDHLHPEVFQTSKLET
ncbi:uncharacterized protein [Tiliqua scincoides]|uniref:uncharacterized protein isoform X2 n=1 Tax=Tiliqua scincoides TaxID=71010 RepID=UPI003462D57F